MYFFLWSTFYAFMPINVYKNPHLSSETMTGVLISYVIIMCDGKVELMWS